MNRTISSLVGLAALAATGCSMLSNGLLEEVHATGPEVSKEATAAEFDKVLIQGPYEVAYTVGPVKAVKLDAQKEVVDATEIKIENGRLSVRMTKNVRTDKPIKLTIATPNLTALEIGGACSFKTSGTVKGPFVATVSGASSLEIAGGLSALEVSGASKVLAKGVKGQKLAIEGSGASNITVVAEVDDVAIEASGATQIKPGISAKRAAVEASGASSVRISVADQLVAEASGASDIRYNGKVTQVKSEANGASSVQRGD